VPAEESEPQRYAVLDVFGMKLEVSNPRLAELLTMEAGDALTTDVEELFGAPADRRVIEQGVPDAILAPPTPASEHADHVRRAFRGDVDALGTRLGFEVDSDSTWSSPTGVEILVRSVERPLTLAAATHFVSEVGGASLSDVHAVLYVVESQQTSDVFKVAIRQQRQHDTMRTASLASLRDLADLMAKGVIDHRQIVMLLAPVADIDVGEMLSVLHAAGQGAP
jgi:hypothetical protein